jgi:hypothetical protein
MGFLSDLNEKSKGSVSYRAVLGTYLVIFLAILVGFEVSRDDRSTAINEFCYQSELTHKRDVQGLVSTYDYVKDLTEDDLRQSLNRAVVLQLPKTEDTAKDDVAPEICDETYKAGFLGLSNGSEYGLPEPDPVIPERPAEVNAALQFISSTSPITEETPKAPNADPDK